MSITPVAIGVRGRLELADQSIVRSSHARRPGTQG